MTNHTRNQPVANRQFEILQATRRLEGYVSRERHNLFQMEQNRNVSLSLFETKVRSFNELIDGLNRMYYATTYLHEGNQVVGENDDTGLPQRMNFFEPFYSELVPHDIADVSYEDMNGIEPYSQMAMGVADSVIRGEAPPTIVPAESKMTSSGLDEMLYPEQPSKQSSNQEKGDGSADEDFVWTDTTYKHATRALWQTLGYDSEDEFLDAQVREQAEFRDAQDVNVSVDPILTKYRNDQALVDYEKEHDVDIVAYDPLLDEGPAILDKEAIEFATHKDPKIHTNIHAKLSPTEQAIHGKLGERFELDLGSYGFETTTSKALSKLRVEMARKHNGYLLNDELDPRITEGLSDELVDELQDKMGSDLMDERAMMDYAVFSTMAAEDEVKEDEVKDVKEEVVTETQAPTSTESSDLVKPDEQPVNESDAPETVQADDDEVHVTIDDSDVIPEVAGDAPVRRSEQVHNERREHDSDEQPDEVPDEQHALNQAVAEHQVERKEGDVDHVTHEDIDDDVVDDMDAEYDDFDEPVDMDMDLPHESTTELRDPDEPLDIEPDDALEPSFDDDDLDE